MATPSDSSESKTEESKEKFVSLVLKKTGASAEDAIDAIATLGEATKDLVGWELDSLSIGNYG